MTSYNDNNNSLNLILSLALENTEKNSLDKNSDDYYRDALTNISQGQILSWNWPAFFFGHLWFLYRKMYFLAFIMLLFSFLFIGASGVLNILTLKLDDGIIFLFNLVVMMILSGCLGNWFYYKSLSRRVRKGYHLISVPRTDGWCTFFGVLGFPIPVLSFVIGLCKTISARQKIANYHRALRDNNPAKSK